MKTINKLMVRPSKYNIFYGITGVLVAIAFGIVVARIFAAGPSSVTSATPMGLGQIANPQAIFVTRDGGASGMLGSKVLWTFGDTIFPRKSARGVTSYSSTAGYAEVGQPTRVSEPLDAKGVPAAALLPLNTEETLYNIASGKPDERYALWPSQVITESASSSLIMYTRLKVHPGGGGLNYELLGTGFARIKAGETTATRLVDGFWHSPGPYFTQGHMQANGFNYFYGCSQAGFGQGTCKVARTPVGKVLDRDSYTFWAGSSWSRDITKADGSTPGTVTGFSVAYNQYLNSYTSVYASGFSKDIVFRTAPTPQGPWSDPVKLYTAPSYLYAVGQHAELSTDGGHNIFVSYFRPDEQPPYGTGHALQLMKITLNTNSDTTSSTESTSQPAANSTAASPPGSSTTQAEAGSLTAGQSANGQAVDGSLVDMQTPSESSGTEPQKSIWQRIWYVITAPWRWLAGLF